MKFSVCRVLALSVSALVISSASAARIELLVPAYFYPSSSGSFWNNLTSQAAAGTPITAIMNPGSGAGLAQNADYVAAVNAFRAAGGKVVGYVPSGYQGALPNAGSSCQPATGTTYTASDVIACAQNYANWYTVDGIFVDEYTNTTGASTLQFYRDIYTGLKGINSTWQVIGNPGTPTAQDYFTGSAGRTADTLVVFENSAGYPSYTPSAWNANFPATSFAHLLYNVPSASDALLALAQARAQNAGYFFVTDDSGANPWDTLPAYFSDLAAGVRAANANPAPAPSTIALFAFAFLALARIGRMRK